MAYFLVGSTSAQQAGGPMVEATTVPVLRPEAVAYDLSGNLFIALRGDHIIRKIDTLGLITTVAGTGEQGFGGDGGAATNAMLDSPSGIAVDANGNLYIADSRNQRIRLVANGVIRTIAGNGVAGFSGDGGSASSAELNLPTALSLDALGNLYFADTNNQRVRRISSALISTVAGSGDQGFGGDGQAATSAQLDSPMGVAVDAANPARFYIGDTRNQRVRMVDANGNISTVAGNGALGFAGEGTAATAATLASPQGLSTDVAGNLYFADSNNQRIRRIAAGLITTAAGSGEQGFSGDLGAARSATLDTPHATASGPDGLLAVADTHNQRLRSVAGATVNTVAGVPPAMTEGLLLSGPIAGTYGVSPGRLNAIFSSQSNVPSGLFILNVDGQASMTAPVTGSSASYDLGFLSGGLHSLVVSYPGDSGNPPVVSGLYLVNVTAATQSITFPIIAGPVTYPPGSTTILAATSSSGLPVTYAVSGPAMVSGSALTYTGAGTVVVTAIQSGNADYAAASAVRSISVSASVLVASNVSPNSVPLGTANALMIVTGSGFAPTTVIRWNGEVLPSTVVNSTRMTALLPQVLTTASMNVTAYDASTQQESAPLAIVVTVPNASATLSTLGVAGSAQQPSTDLRLQAAYPVPINGKFVLTFTPASGVADDPAVQFSSGGRSYSFIIPADSTTVPTLAFQTGTVTGTLVITLSLNASGVDVTPPTARTAAIVISEQVPDVTNVSFTQSGPTLTVIVTGFSNVRNVSQADFSFVAAPGSSLTTTSMTVPVRAIFNDWFASSASSVLGSIFGYTQVFDLGDANAKVQTVTVTLTNSIGASAPVTSP